MKLYIEKMEVEGTIEYCVYCGEEITQEDYDNGQVKVPINDPSNKLSCHINCEKEKNNGIY